MNLPFTRKRHLPLTPNINLYPEDPFYSSLIGRILRWAVSAGRHIIIFTELVVIGSFASRFVLDRQLSDLNMDIVQKQSIVESYGSLEEDFRGLQQQSKDITEILTEQGKYQVLKHLETLTPPEIKYDQIGYSNNTLNLRGTALSNAALSQLIEGLRRHQDFSAVTITSIRGGDIRDPSIQFNVTARSTLGGVEATPAPARSTGAAEEEVAL